MVVGPLLIGIPETIGIFYFSGSEVIGGLPIAVVEKEFFAGVYVLDSHKANSHFSSGIHRWKQFQVSPLGSMVDVSHSI